ncbi:hypothetical protein [Vibrio hepatarius]|uniref:hypothetical protein n=1 Tax=Vibrio hepatarius TaxID=171383 RepID=UPI00148B830D|nr:hypothetical protein [Vibrio hepatarius]NOI13808.1 hypothetical protein [Vibrio hepatarius]
MPRINSSGWKSGDLKIHSGTLEDIPNGWELAQDMVDRAVVGAGNLYSKGQQFGAVNAATQQSTLSEAQGPVHVHKFDRRYGSSGGTADAPDVESRVNKNQQNTHASGESLPHDHGNVSTIQPSIGVIWIRKL